MDRLSNMPQTTIPDKLTAFLHELMLYRRQLALYPEKHPRVKTAIASTQGQLNELFLSQQSVTLVVTPDALRFEQHWLDKKNPVNRNFAAIFSTLGIASISFHKGLSLQELTFFNQLLNLDRKALETSGGIEHLLEKQEIECITIVPIDYSIFQSSQDTEKQQEQLWESFLHTLQSGAIDLTELTDMLNRKLTDGQEQHQFIHSLDLLFEKNIQQGGLLQVDKEAEDNLYSLLDQLDPEAKKFFFDSIFRVLDRHPDTAPGLLKRIPLHLIEEILAAKAQQEVNISSRLFDLANTLVSNSTSRSTKKINAGTEKLSTDALRSRLDILFNEELQDDFSPGRYQSAMENILDINFSDETSVAEKKSLLSCLEAQSIESNLAAIFYDLLQKGALDSEEEAAIQRNLLDLSRFFLDIGDFVNLRDIYRYWSEYLSGGNTKDTESEEQILATHTQETFMAEVVKGFDLWGEKIHPQISEYICFIGEPYIELIIDRLGSATTHPQKRRWMGILGKIASHAHEKIVHHLTDKRWQLVHNLLVLLGKMPNFDGVKSIQRLCNHPRPQIRLEAMRILFSRNAEAADIQLLRELRNADPDIRLAALKLAALSQNQTVRETLNSWLIQKPRKEQELEILTQTIRALTRIGNKDSLLAFRQILSKKGLFVGRLTRQLQMEIIQNLAIFPGEQSIQLLQEFSTGRFKNAANKALEKRL
ncbi:MAG: hypothetical protein KAG92_04695 [Deltaproteobacteria bacterium]|nr:hypothetical protein [Deltaproteobacteria bacterium]